MIQTSTSRNRYASGETDLIVGDLRTALKVQTKGAIWCHGSGEDAEQAYRNWGVHCRQIGLQSTLHIGDLGLQTWGSNEVVDRIEDAIEYLQNSSSVVGKVALIGMSMGACSALNYAVRYPENVSCVAARPQTQYEDLGPWGHNIPTNITSSLMSFLARYHTSV